MSRIGHSTLLKYFVDTSKMSEQTEKNDSTIESKVPGEQTLRGDYIKELKTENAQQNDVAITDYSLSPVIKVTKEESTFTKGDLKLQKVIVTEDISDETAASNTKLTITEKKSPIAVQTEVHSEMSSVTINTEGDTQTSTGEQKVSYKVTKIPKLKFKQAVDKIKMEEKMIKEGKDEARLGLKVSEAIPRLKDEKTVLQESSGSETIKQDSPKVDDEFDKIYDEIFENGPPSGNFPSPAKIEDLDKLETKFEEIIHAYDEQKAHTSNVEKVKSKIPLLKRKSEQDIYAKQSIRKNSLKKRNSVDDTKCKLPVPLIKEKKCVELGLNSSQTSKNESVETKTKTISAKNITVFETVNTNISKTLTTSQQKSSEILTTLETESNTISEVSKSKIPMHLKKTIAVEKTSDIQTSETSSHLCIEKENEDRLIIINKTEVNEPETVVTEDTIKTLNVKDNISKITTEPLIIVDNLENISNTKNNNNKEMSSNIATGDIDNSKQTTETDIKSHIAKVDVKNLHKANDLTQNEKALDASNSNNDFHESKHISENNFAIKEIQKIHINDTNSSLSINHEVRETVRVVSIEFPISDTNNIQDNINDNVTKNIPKDISQISGAGVYFENNLFDNKVIQEIKYDDSKTKLSDKNVSNNDNFDMNTERTQIITEQVDLKTQNYISGDILRSNNESTLSQYSIDKLESESIKKSSDSSINGSRDAINIDKELISPASIDTKTGREILIIQQQSESKVQRQEVEQKLTKHLYLQEETIKSDTISNKSTTEVNNNQINTEVIKGNNAIQAIASNEVHSSENNEKDINELEEEDIILLKGKVNRIKRRLDSKELKINKCELDDVPPEVSVVSKIALFEQSKSMDTTQKGVTKAKLAGETNLDKPKIVDGLLKIENGSLKTDSKFSYDTFLNYKETIKNNRSIDENSVQTKVSTKGITNFDKIFKTNINLNSLNKIEDNKVLGRFEDEVFAKKEEVNRNIINEYKINKEIDLDFRRAKSLAELNYDGVRGRVRQMVVRMNSIDKIALERREQNEVRKKTRHGSVSERIALFEKKITPMRMESVSTTTSSPKQEEITPALNDDDLNKRIAELTEARATYGRYENMTYIELSDGGRLPTLTIGTALLDSQLVKPIIKAAIDLGYRAIDTAYIYGNEQAVGEAIREKIQDGTVKREELFILSKLWSTNHRRDLVPRACRQSLDTMGLEYFDLYLIHNPMSFKEGSNPVPKIANVLQYSEHDYLDAWFGIESLIKQGLVKRGGVSNFNSVQVDRVLDKGKIKPVVNQVECHPYLSQARLQDYLSSRGVALSCFGCLGSSGTPRELRSSLPPVIHDPLVRTMAAGLGITPAQLLISYQVSLGRGVVVKASSAAHLWDNLRALSVHLAPAHSAALTALNRNKRTFTFEGMGDTHKNYPFKIPF